MEEATELSLCKFFYMPLKAKETFWGAGKGCLPLPEQTGGSHTKSQMDVLTCRGKALISCSFSLLELPIPDCSHQSSFQMFQTQMQSRCLGATRRGMGRDKGRPSSGISIGSARPTHTTSVTSGQTARRVLARQEGIWTGVANSRHKTQRTGSGGGQGERKAGTWLNVVT